MDTRDTEQEWEAQSDHVTSAVFDPRHPSKSYPLEINYGPRSHEMAECHGLIRRATVSSHQTLLYEPELMPIGNRGLV
jgi:hypothetical protein